MDPKTVAELHDFTLEARHFLEKEASEQLEGIYGWVPTGEIKPAKEYPALKSHAEAKETRRRLEQYFADETAAGLKAKQAREKLVQETAFTWLNRFVAFKLMEGNGLLRQTVSKGADSNAFKLWLTEPGKESWLAEHVRGDLPKDGVGEGPRERAYRQFLLAQCAKLAEEIRVLFDPGDLPSCLFPRPVTCKRLIDLLNGDNLAEAWRPGNEETIGWVYQSFNAEELERAFREARVSGKKFQKEDIPSVTQLFTPRLAVRFLVENTLGRLWVQMHPDSELATKWQYLVPADTSTVSATLKPAREISFLDPACGTMHFGLVAFDMFEEMYKEELRNAGKAGWPDEPSVKNEGEIPAAIVENNLFGIDIDLRAVQLAALTLYFRAKKKNPAAVIRDTNLAIAGVEISDGARLDEFVAEMKFKEPLYEKVIRAVWKELEDAQQLGSLMRPEKVIEKVVQAEKKAHGGGLPLFESVWPIVDAQIVQAFDEFARREGSKGRSVTFFTGEGVKGFRLLNLFARRYDVVATNPPYMSGRKMNPELKELIAEHYRAGKGDLYAAFVQRCLELADEAGLVGILSMHSFMFISSYEGLRGWITGRATVECLSHYGPGLFAVGNPGTLQTAAYILRREGDEERRKEAVGTYFRLVKELDAYVKKTAFEEALCRLKNGEQDSHVFRYRQADFNDIPGSPWVYWIRAGVRNLFKTLPKLHEISEPRQGLATANDKRFLRCWWEVGIQRVAVTCPDAEAGTRSGKRWFPLTKGGAYKKWYGNREWVVNWGREGKEIKEYICEAYPYLDGKWQWVAKNTEYYFRPGVTWSALSSKGLSARSMPLGSIPGHKGPACFSEAQSGDLDILGVLNSKPATALLKVTSPTIMFEVGQLAGLPFPRVYSDKLRKLVADAVANKRADSEDDESTFDFVAPPAWSTGVRDVEDRYEHLAAIECELNEEAYRLYGINAEDRAAIEVELAAGVTPASGYKSNEEWQNSDSAGDAEGEEQPLTREELAHQWISYAMGVVLGRFEIGKTNGLGCGRFDPETCERLQNLVGSRGILVQDGGHPDDFTHRVLEALQVMVGTKEAGEVVHAAAGQDGPAEEVLPAYLNRNFFKLHVQMYRKRPVYWLLQSPRRLYGIWLFHERVTKDTLLWIQTDYVKPKISRLESELKEIKGKEESASGSVKRELKKRKDDVIEALDDVREFQKRLNGVIQRGYTPHIDDGVLLNMAPLWELIPAWQAEPKKAWQALKEGKYDWAHQAMDHWPDRVKEKCKTNKSFAIAHGLEKLEAAGG